MIWLGYRDNFVESKLNKIIKFNYQITQYQRMKLEVHWSYVPPDHGGAAKTIQTPPWMAMSSYQMISHVLSMC
jgi:hypothetical protein